MVGGCIWFGTSDDNWLKAAGCGQANDNAVVCGDGFAFQNDDPECCKKRKLPPGELGSCIETHGFEIRALRVDGSNV